MRIEKTKEAQKGTIKEEVKLESIWPQLKNASNWSLRNHIEGAENLVRMISCRRRKELEKEEMQRESTKGDEKDPKRNNDFNFFKRQYFKI